MVVSNGILISNAWLGLNLGPLDAESIAAHTKASDKAGILLQFVPVVASSASNLVTLNGRRISIYQFFPPRPIVVVAVPFNLVG